MKALFLVIVLLCFSGAAFAQVNITTTSLPAGTIGSAYGPATLTATGGTTPYTWTITTGSLPTGLTLSAGGAISGTPTAAGSNFTVKVTDNSGTPLTATKVLAISLNPFSITTFPVLPATSVGTPYAMSLSASGGVLPYTWSNTGSLPPGFILSSDGILSGTPTTAGSFTITVTVTDSFSTPQTTSRSFTIAIAAMVSITTGTLPTGSVNKSYSQTLNATAGSPPYSWSLASGNLPDGLSLSSDGIISGTPSAAGTFNFTVSVTDSSSTPQTASKALTITIQAALTITTAADLPLAVVGAFYSFLMEATGPSPVTWSVISGIAPPGLSLTGSGALTGTPQVAGTFNFTVQASGGSPAQTATLAMHIVVNEALTIVTAATLPDATLANPYSVSLLSNGGLPPYTWTNPGGGLPSGLTISSAGILSGTPTGVGTFTFTLQVVDSFTPIQRVTRTFVLTVSTALSITTVLIPSAIQNVAYSQQLQATGNGPFTWIVTAGTLPNGLTLSPTGLLQGTPVEVGSQTVTLKVTDARGANATRDFTIVVNPPVPSLSVPALPTTVGTRQITDVGLSLATAYPSPLAGQLKLAFTSAAEVPSDDPMTQFSNGSRTVSFTIPANTTAAVFASKIMLLTGTVAGTVRLTASIDNGPADLAVATVTIPPVAPQMTDVSAIRGANGLDVQITGYAPSRRVTSVEFTFDVRSGSTTQRIPLTRSVDTEFGDWYRNAASTPFGSAFSFLQSFTIQGADPSAIVGVTVRLTNAQGSTSSSTIAPK